HRLGHLVADHAADTGLAPRAGRRRPLGHRLFSLAAALAVFAVFAFFSVLAAGAGLAGAAGLAGCASSVRTRAIWRRTPRIRTGLSSWRMAFLKRIWNSSSRSSASWAASSSGVKSLSDSIPLF